MNCMLRTLSRAILSGCLLSLVLFAGCGTSEYESRQMDTRDVLMNRSPYMRRLTTRPMDVFNRAVLAALEIIGHPLTIYTNVPAIRIGLLRIVHLVIVARVPVAQRRRCSPQKQS